MQARRRRKRRKREMMKIRPDERGLGAVLTSTRRSFETLASKYFHRTGVNFTPISQFTNPLSIPYSSSPFSLSNSFPTSLTTTATDTATTFPLAHRLPLRAPRLLLRPLQWPVQSLAVLPPRTCSRNRDARRPCHRHERPPARSPRAVCRHARSAGKCSRFGRQRIKH